MTTESGRPFFLVLGAPKCGTTALADAIAAHPGVLMSRPKEPHFFDARHEQGLAGYLDRHFPQLDARRVAGEATPSYLALPWVPGRIAAALPQARLVAVLRNPVDRAFSSWWMFHARGMEPLAFADAIRENERRLSESPLADDDASRDAWAKHVESLARGDTLRVRTYLDSGDYAPQLRRYLGHFPRERLLVLFSDELRSDGPGTLRKVWRHLGVAEDSPVLEIAAANEAVGAGASGVLRLLRASRLMGLRRLLPARALARFKRALGSMGERPAMPADTRARLIDHFAPRVTDLEKLLAVDLSHWKR